ncbi:MAG: hypothetical protein E7302_05840 [Butyrivibrio sp.]|jgi:hypothetical protein|nr:hypothetical protein [Butyrivibrio sp.]
MMIKNKFIAIALSAVLAIPAAVTLIPGTGIETKAEAAIDVTTYGALPDDNVDDREAINNAIRAANEAGGGTVTMPAGTFDVILEPLYGMGIELQNNVTLSMDKNTILKVKSENKNRYEIISIKWKENVAVTGGQILGDKKSHKGKLSEDCFGVRVIDSKKVKIQNMTIKNVVTDGIYLGASNNSSGCNNVKITNCIINSSGRNNIAIVDADNVTIDKCKIYKAQGRQPECGINIEPNTNGGKPKKSQICKNITIKNTKVTCVKMGVDNHYFALQIINPYHYDSSLNNAIANKVTITNCDLGGDCGNFSGTNVTFNKCKIKGTLYTKKPTKLKKTTYGRKESY